MDRVEERMPVEVVSCTMICGTGEMIVEFNLATIRFFFFYTNVDVSPEHDWPIYEPEAIGKEIGVEVLEVHALDLNQNDVWQIAERYGRMHWELIHERVFSNQ